MFAPMKRTEPSARQACAPPGWNPYSPAALVFEQFTAHGPPSPAGVDEDVPAKPLVRVPLIQMSPWKTASAQAPPPAIANAADSASGVVTGRPTRYISL